jgi:hypothetical protein
MFEIRQVLSAQVFRLIAALQPPAPRVDIVKKLQERYKFLKVPTTVEELFPVDPTHPIKFEQGAFTRDDKSEVVIDSLQLLPNVLIAQTHTSTDDAEAFLKDYIDSANKGLAETITPFGAPLYVSQIEFSSDKPLEHHAPSMKSAAESLDALVGNYGSKIPPYRVAGITVNFDFTALGGIVAAHFSIERRSGIPDALNIFYSHAPLKTSDHIVLLQRLYQSGA